jgi:hypothetical protein
LRPRPGEAGPASTTRNLSSPENSAVVRAAVHEYDFVGLKRLGADGGDEARERPLLVADGDDQGDLQGRV